MKTIELAHATKPLSDYAKDIADGLIVTKRGKPVAVLTPAHGMDVESISLANNPKFVAIIEQSRSRAAREGTISADEVRRRLGLPPFKPRRSSRKKAAASA
jgi:antitoxin (DNA-binding transcriptional repressor) of toxin-antitoxin stability system